VNLSGKVALVTGGAARLGGAITRGLAQAGANVVIHYNSSAGPAAERAEEVHQLGVGALPVQANLADPTAALRVVDAALERFGRVDVLVHAASPFKPLSLSEVTLEAWREIQGVLVESFLLLVQGLAPGMVKRSEGAIVSILDRGAFEPWPQFLPHGVGKSALWALTRSLAVGLAPHVRVNAVIPGPVLPPPGYTEEKEKQLAQTTLMERWGNPQDIVDAVLFLVRSDYVTGEALFVDGGERWAHRRSGS
jgi:NAD(P)-dependent dehydrogenase (short-subunit alcohol dehydrogenase family)